jgi:hypothetical protein
MMKTLSDLLTVMSMSHYLVLYLPHVIAQVSGLVVISMTYLLKPMKLDSMVCSLKNNTLIS